MKKSSVDTPKNCLIGCILAVALMVLADVLEHFGWVGEAKDFLIIMIIMRLYIMEKGLSS
ncbi:MAG: hypothetical protein COB09_16980 [Thalassobium sp.]|nr:MAG: hypothetical protein COB09_16980 [Thalassobium sp.]